MTVSIEDNNNLIGWWRKQLEGNNDWNSLPNETKRQLLLKLQQCVSALLQVYITKEEILKLIQLTDITTVFSSCVSMLALPDLEHKNKHQILAYLTRVILNSEIAKIKVDPIWQSPLQPEKKKGKIATLEYAKKYDPYNFKPTCKVCGSHININNTTGVCSKCQKKGRNGN